MGAPRLLDKKTVNAEQASQQRQKIMEGITLAKKVDALRVSLGDEQERLEKFRIETTKRIQKDIDAIIGEREDLIKGNEKLKEERIRLQAPLDLKEEWEHIRAFHSENETWQSTLINQQVEILAREADSQTLSNTLRKRDSDLKDRETLAERMFKEAEEQFSEASSTLSSSKEKAKEICSRAASKERNVEIREQEVNIWNEDLMSLEKELKEKDTELTNRETALQRRYETFLKAQNYIKNKK